MTSKPKQYKIVIVDDDEEDFFITSAYISLFSAGRFDLVWSSTFAEGVEKFKSGEYDLFFVDYLLGQYSGVDFLKAVNANQSDIPVILLTGKGNKQVDMQAMELGAVDYLSKGELNEEKLERTIRYAIERAATLRALRESERKFRSVFETSKDIIFITDADLNIKEVNDAVTQLSGFTKDEARTSNLSRYIPALLLEQWKMNDPAAPDFYEADITFKDKAGADRAFILTIIRQTDQVQGISYLGVAHDITDLRNIEKARLMSEKLGASARLAKTIAHEIRNPLNNIQLSIEQLTATPVDEDAQLYLGIIDRNAQRINVLIKDLLENAVPVEQTLVAGDLVELLLEILDESDDKLKLNQINLKLKLPAERVVIPMERSKLKLALLNIFNNAIEAMSETGKKILTVGLKAGKSAPVLEIVDTGCGISEENILQIFEPHYTRKKNGIGLGLTFALNIIHSHKAQMNVSSKIGEGTTFLIRF